MDVRKVGELRDNKKKGVSDGPLAGKGEVSDGGSYETDAILLSTLPPRGSLLLAYQTLAG